MVNIQTFIVGPVHQEVRMKSAIQRQTVDRSAFPDLVVIYLGMRVNARTGMKTVFGLGPQIQAAASKCIS
jgi:hypothetical protein